MGPLVRPGRSASSDGRSRQYSQRAKRNQSDDAAASELRTYMSKSCEKGGREIAGNAQRRTTLVGEATDRALAPCETQVGTEVKEEDGAVDKEEDRLQIPITPQKRLRRNVNVSMANQETNVPLSCS